VVLKDHLLARSLSEDDLSAIRDEVEIEVEEIVEYAQESAWPDRAEAYTDVYKV
jgi:pyruvate dehydrogenase E1 component alpha subunit